MSEYQFETIATTPFSGQRPGTSGLRKRVEVFQRPGYLENFIQSLFETLGEVRGRTLVLGGDGRFFNREAIQIILKMAAARGFGRVLLGRAGILSTPAASLAIRENRALGGIILSASHNPGGPRGDFGVKYNAANGGPANLDLTERVYERSLNLQAYCIAKGADVDIDNVSEQMLGSMRVVVFDPIAAYAALMERLFDFDRIRALVSGAGFELRFDAMHAVTGPYAREIIERRLGATEGSVLRGVPLPDFGGCHPDPNSSNAGPLTAAMGERASFGAASDGDGDRNLIMAPGFFVSPSDSLSIMAANAHLLPGYRQGIAGVARSMPTSRAVDRVAKALDIDCSETPTGWKFFGNLLDANRVTLCGEESFGQGSDHVREKDGLWAVLYWLNLLAVRDMSVAQIVREHWRRFGRDFYSRHDYSGLDADTGESIMAGLRAGIADLPGRCLHDHLVVRADDFSYCDPVDGEVTDKQGVRVEFANGARVVFRLSGTGTSGATLRVYLEQYQPDASLHDGDTASVLKDLAGVARDLCGIKEKSGRSEPDVVT